MKRRREPVAGAADNVETLDIWICTAVWDGMQKIGKIMLSVDTIPVER